MNNGPSTDDITAVLGERNQSFFASKCLSTKKCDDVWEGSQKWSKNSLTSFMENPLYMTYSFFVFIFWQQQQQYNNKNKNNNITTTTTAQHNNNNSKKQKWVTFRDASIPPRRSGTKFDSYLKF